MRHVLEIPGWLPCRLNQLLGHWSTRHRLKKIDRATVGLYARMARIPHAKGKRRVSLVLTLAPRQRAADPDAWWKSLLDALVQAGLLVDDNRQGCELGSVTFRRGREKATTIILEDVEEA
jgi:Holliday junction resolvase RusA-like endonuclease